MNLENIIIKYNIHSLFETLPSFTLKTFEKGEILVSPVNPLKQFHLVVDGMFHVYSIHDDGTYHTVILDNRVTLLGDIEFTKPKKTEYYVEAKSKLTVLVFDMSEDLKKDVSFLNFLIQSLAYKLQISTSSIVDYTSLEEKVFHYMKDNHDTLDHVEQTSLKLHCSRRQLQRILVKLMEQGKIEKIKKGTYKIKEI